jgi:hypothetical protein
MKYNINGGVIAHIANQLNNLGEGKLSEAVCLVAKEYDVDVVEDDNLREFLNRQKITPQSTYNDDIQTLDRLDILKPCLIDKLFGLLGWQPSEPIVIGAAFILLSCSLSSKKERPILRNISLSLVLKGTELGRVDEGSALSLEQVKEMLHKTTSFSCIFREEMEQRIKYLDLNDGEPDRTSERPVLLMIRFEGELREGQSLTEKIRVQEFLSNIGGVKFVVDSVRILNRKGGLERAGFVHS